MIDASGVLAIDKPVGASSARVVGWVKRLLAHKVKVGHAGTLDPFATGVLLVLVGKATKLSEQLMGQPKKYVATIKLGAITDTLDPTSPETFVTSAPPVHREAIDAVLTSFSGQISQMPPNFSALKVGGRRAYQLARLGENVVLEPRLVMIYSITLLKYEWPFLTIDLYCGKGTYVRSLARDIGEKLGVGGGYLTELRRTAVGEFAVEDAVKSEALKSVDDVMTRLTIREASRVQAKESSS